MDELPPPCEMDPGQAQPVEEVHDLEIVDDPYGFSTFPYPCKMRPDQVPLVTSLVEEYPGLKINVKTTEGESVLVTFLVPCKTEMPKLFKGMRDALNPPTPIDMAAREGVVFAKSEEPKLASRPPEEHPFTLRRTSSRFRALLPHPLQES